ncbi:MAG: hypothetical protein ABSH47_22730 [Bryobacteraceae bacterium]|jgi:hypothetical protein
MQSTEFGENARYQPMFRLLAEEDADYLLRVGQPTLARQIRRKHRYVFRMYLRELGEEVYASFHRRRGLIARGAWSHLEDYYSDGVVFLFHYGRLNAAAVLHAMHVPAAAAWAEESLRAVLRMAGEARFEPA